MRNKYRNECLTITGSGWSTMQGCTFSENQQFKWETKEWTTPTASWK